MIKTTKTTKKKKVAVLQTDAVSTEPQKAAPAKPAQVSLELVKPEAKKVCVAGSFNDWNPEKTPLRSAGDGRWVGSLRVDPGRYEYLFVVDGQWVTDPNAIENVQNPYGGQNSILRVSP